MIKDFIEALEEERAYDFIANHYYEMSKEDLKTILLEYIYASQNKDIGEIKEELESYCDD